MFNKTHGVIIPDCPLPLNVRALVTSRVSFQHPARSDSFSSGYDNFNLALHVNDNAEKVTKNRLILAQHLQISPSNIPWLEQVHGTRVVNIEKDMKNGPDEPTIADAITSQSPHHACTVMTADCLPVLFCDTKANNEARQVAAAHAGWRGLAEGILSRTVSTFTDTSKVIAWLGPAISQKHFEVGEEVYDAFISKNPANQQAFILSPASSTTKPKWLASLTTLAKIELEQQGINAIYEEGWCTFGRPDLFYSYRRDGAQSGRIASLIMLT